MAPEEAEDVFPLFRPRIRPMDRERMTAERKSRPPFFYVSQRTGHVVELSASAALTAEQRAKPPLVMEASRLLKLKLLSEDEFARVKAWHNRWHRRGARWLGARLLRWANGC